MIAGFGELAIFGALSGPEHRGIVERQATPDLAAERAWPMGQDDTLVERLEAELRRLGGKIEDLAKEADVLRERQAELRSALKVIREYAPAPETPVAPSATGPTHRYSNRDLTLKDAGAEVLADVGRPLQPTELAEILLSRGLPYRKGVKKLAGSLGAMLRRDHNDGGRFVRLDDAEGRYGLRAWIDRSETASEQSPIPGLDDDGQL